MALSCSSCRPLLIPGALSLAFVALAGLAPGCASKDEGAGEQGSGEPIEFQSFEAFRASLYLEPWQGGAYIVEGDIAVFGDDALRAYYEGLHVGQNALVIGSNDGEDVLWSSGEYQQLSYCVDGTFNAGEKTTIVEALRSAGSRWQAVADVQFTYKPSEDDNCNDKNNQVTFNVTKVQTNEKYFARAFFPNQPRDRRALNVDQLAFEPVRASIVDDVMTHELGHILGFRHEHARPEATRQDPVACSENNSGWHAYTPYDDRSVMTYPECGGYEPGQFAISATDAEGAVAIYGSPGHLQPDNATATTYRYELFGIPGGVINPFNTPFIVRGGSTFVAVLKGATNADQPNLYVNRGDKAQPGTAECEPSVENDSPETCRIEVPPGPNAEVFVSYQVGGNQGSLGLTIVYVPGN